MLPSHLTAQGLSPGDQMDLDEFLRRWELLPELKCAELIDGTVYMPSPVSVPHGKFDSRVQAIGGYYGMRSGICSSNTNITWLMRGSAPQPDLALSLKPEYGGKLQVNQQDLATGLPELVVEVCGSSRSYDLGPKLALYQRAGVPEYLAILIEEKRFEWRVLVDGRYQSLKADNGIYRSRMLPGLWIDETAFWNEDDGRLLAVLDEGLQSPELSTFRDPLRPV